MRSSVPFGMVAGLLLVLGSAATVLADGSGEEGIGVEPASVTAGDTVILAGSGLEPNNERVIVLAGQDLVVDFGTVTTDAAGMFQTELTIPSHLPSGVYEFRAIGDEILTAPLAVTAAAGGGGSSPVPNDLSNTVVPRERTAIEFSVVLALAAAAALAGAFLVWRAEGRRSTSAA